MTMNIQNFNEYFEFFDMKLDFCRLQAYFATISAKIIRTSHKAILLWCFHYVPPATPFQCCLDQTLFDHPRIELGEGDQKLKHQDLSMSQLLLARMIYPSASMGDWVSKLPSPMTCDIGVGKMYNFGKKCVGCLWYHKH